MSSKGRQHSYLSRLDTFSYLLHLLAVNFDLVINTYVLPLLEETAVLECAHQLRKMGDLLDWKYKLLDILRNYSQAAKIK